MNIKKLTLATLVISLMTPTVFAQKSPSLKGISYKISPLFGYETTFRSTPTPHTSTHFMYGVRLTAGVEKISGELEVTRGTDSENYLVAPETINYTDDKLKLGITSVFKLTDYLNASARLGGQAKKTTQESISGGIPTKTEDPIEYSPYAGAAIGLNLGFIGIHVGTTVVFKDINDMQKNEYQNTLTISAGI